MPLLRKKTFETTSLPEFLRDDEEVFLCEVTNEIFRDYEEFCQRIILVNSMVWSCSMTGKSNLTYAEALNSEHAARKSIQDFPYELRTAVLYLASKTKRTAFGDMVEDVFSFIKDRYFAGEIVESSFTENNWKESHVLQVIAPTEEQITTYKSKNTSPERSSFLPASLYRYEVEQLDANDQDSSQIMIVEASHIRRKKGPFSKDKTRLFLKQFVEQNDKGLFVIKDVDRKKFNLDHVQFEQIFDGPMPDFDTSKVKVKTTANGKKVRQETLAKYLKKQNYFSGDNPNGKKLLEDMKRKEEEYKQKCEEMKLKKDEEKKLEKQKRREENLKMSSYVREWYKPSDDLELEDQKELPAATLVQSKIPHKHFGDALMVMDFSVTFASFLSVKDFFPGGLTLDLMERALTEKEVAGPFTDIIQMLLTAIFNVQDEEAAENKHSQADLNSEDISETMSLSEASNLATVSLNWSVTYQGMTLNRLPLYPLTVSEILRLHLLSSGAKVRESAAKWRFQQRGGYTSEDDPGLTLRVKYPHILKALSIHNVNQLNIGDKLKILVCLVNQLLTYADVRDAIEENLEKQRKIKATLKVVQIAERKREHEYITNKIKIKKDSKANGIPDITTNRTIEILSEEAEKKRTAFEIKIKKLIKASFEGGNYLGSDRAFRRYRKTKNLPGIFIENDEKNPGICLDKIVQHHPELVDADSKTTLQHVRQLLEEIQCNGSDKENEHKNSTVKINGVKNPVKLEDDINKTRELLMCTANNLPCPVHSKNGKPEWSFYYKKEEFDQLCSSLNKRGIRESDLRQTLEGEREAFEDMFTITNPTILNPTIKTVVENVKKPYSKRLRDMYIRYEDSNFGYPPDVEVSEVLHLTLIDNILEMEEKITSGSLGNLKVMDREQWRDHLANRKYDLLDKTLYKKEESQVDKLKSEEKNSRPGTPDSVPGYRDPSRFLGSTVEQDSDDSDVESIKLSATDELQTSVKALTIALAQVAQGLNPRHLKKPLGHADVSSKSNTKEKCDVFDRWEQSLLASGSYSQIFLHYCTLDYCIMWSRRVKKCRICRRQKDPQNMVQCERCHQRYHMKCLKPKLLSLPEGKWICNKCTSKEKPVTPKTPQKRKIFKEEEEEDNEEEQKEEEEEDYEPDSSDDETSGSEKKANNISTVEVCEECGSGGHVICCDSCPKVYHLECTQPPMRRVPRGEWKCHNCRQLNANQRKERNERSERRGSDKEKESSSDDTTSTSTYDGETAQCSYGIYHQRSCAARARNKIHGFVQTLRRNSVDSGSSDEVAPERRRSYRRNAETSEIPEVMLDDLPLHNAPLQELLADVMKHKDAWPFIKRVSMKEVPDYYEVIQNPMDFGKVKYKLNMGEYKNDSEVMEDAALVFINCNTYNTSDAEVYKCGVRLLKYFEKRCQELGFEFPENVMELNDEDEDGPTKPKRARHN